MCVACQIHVKTKSVNNDTSCFCVHVWQLCAQYKIKATKIQSTHSSGRAHKILLRFSLENDDYDDDDIQPNMVVNINYFSNEI